MVVFRTIRSKIIVGIVSLLIIMTVALTVVATQRTEAALREQIEETHEAHAERIAQDLERRMQDALAFAEAAAQNELFRRPIDPQLRSDNGTVPPDEALERRAFLQQLVATVDLYGAGIVVDADGVVVLGEPVDAQWRYARDAEGSPREAVSSLQVLAEVANETDDGFVVRGQEPGTWSVVVPLRTSGGEFHGILIFEGRNRPLALFAEEAVEREATILLIADDQGRIIAGPEGFATGDDVSGALREIRGGGSQALTLGEDRYLASEFALESTPWRLILATDTDIAFAAVQTILRTTILLGAIALVFGIAMSLVLAQDLSIPIQRLKNAAQRVTAGEYGTQVRIATRDELADLGGAFNAMSSRLQEENQRLMRHQESLESQIDERTRALREKNDELEAFVYAASHDLRTPIISLDWLVQELEDQLEDTETPSGVAETIERVRANIDGMDRLVSDLLELSRIGRTEGEPEPVPVREVVDKALEGLRQSIRDRAVHMQVDVPDEAIIMADRRRMQQVFSNLLGNAIKYGPEGATRVHVRATPIGRADRPWKWRIEVADNGPGIPPEHRERIFMLFQRAPDPLGRPIQGTGVGLAIVRKVIQAYGGQIHVTEAPEGGAMFWFTLPAPRDPRGSRFSGQEEKRTRTPPPDLASAMRPIAPPPSTEDALEARDEGTGETPRRGHGGRRHGVL